MTVTHDMLSPYTKRLKKSLGNNVAPPSLKLVPNLRHKTNYVLHYRNLKQYIDLGMKLTKIHRGISFEQSAWAKEFVDYNTEKRCNATSKFQSDLYKLMTNSIFGKSCEDKKKRVGFELVNDRKRILKVTAKPNYNSFTLFNENLAGVKCDPVKTILDKPRYVGFSVLDISKTLMYEFWYKTIKKLYGHKASLVLTDTDSFSPRR